LSTSSSISSETIDVAVRDEATAWFREHDYDVAVDEHGGYFWATLVRRSSGSIIRDYGRGDSPEAAIARARARYAAEQ
jgi:hypothetical protein